MDSVEDHGLEKSVLHFWRERMYADVEFVVEKDGRSTTFVAHKTVLSLWSPEFEKMFYNPEQISLNVVTIKECDPSAFEAMLKTPETKSCPGSYLSDSEDHPSKPSRRDPLMEVRIKGGANLALRLTQGFQALAFREGGFCLRPEHL